MTAGRELDALVAEKAMGIAGCGDALKELKRQFFPDRDPYSFAMVVKDAAQGLVELCDIPSYSTDIAAAWKVMDLMRKGHKSVALIDSVEHKRWEKFSLALWRDFYPWGGDETDTWDYALFALSPERICLAALKALGVEVPV